MASGHTHSLYQQRAQHAYNVKDYGAQGDGVTNDYTAILATANACPAGGSVYIPAGTYITNSVLALPSGRRYYGDSNQTWIKMGNGTNLAAIAANYEWVNNQNFAGNPTFIENIGFDGNSANNATGGHGFVLQAWQSVVRQCWFKNIPQSAMVVADVTMNGTTLVTNSIVENKLYDLKIATAGQYGIWVQNNNAQCTDGRIESCDINGTTNTAIQVERAAGWYIRNNHVYNVQADGYYINNCYATFIIGNQLAVYGSNAAATGFIHGFNIWLLNGYPTVITDNIVQTSEAATAATYQHMSITANGSSTATNGTYGIITHNQIQGGWANATHGTASLGFNLTAQTGQQTSAQPAAFLVSNNQVWGVQTESSVGSYISTNYPTAHTYGPAQIDGNFSVGTHLVSSQASGVTFAAGAGAGTTPPAPASVSTRDMRGWFTWGTGTTPAAGAQVVVTFKTAYASNPIIVITPQNAATAALQPYVTSVSTTGFTLATGVAPAASQTATTYAVTFMAIQ